MTRLDILSSLVMDAYYQAYPKDSDFLQPEDFEAYVSVFYQQVLQEDFDKTRREMIQMGLLEIGESPVLSDAWYKIKKIDVVEKDGIFSAQLPSTFSFNRDVTLSGIKAIFSNGDIGDCCGKFAKIDMAQCNSLQFLPSSDTTIYFYIIGDKVYFKKVKCGLKSVDVSYIPNLDESVDSDNEIVIPNGLVAEVMTRTYNFLTSAKNGAVIDKTNNQNQNKIIQTEIANPKT